MSPWDRDAWWAGLSYSERLAAVERRDRNAKMAKTYLRKASDALHAGPPTPVSGWYWDLLDVALDVAREIIETLPDDFFASSPGTDWFGDGEPWTFNASDDRLEAAEKLVAAIQARRARGKMIELIARLEAVSGRTDEEAAAHLAKAKQLRERHGIPS